MLAPSFGIAQGWQHLVFQDTNNYFTLKQKALDNFNSDDSLRYQSESGYKQFARWIWFWDDRIDRNGSYSTALENMHYVLDQRMNSQGSESGNVPYSPDWQSIGPVINEDTIDAHMGLVQSLWIDTTDFQTIYAGSNSGGLFKTVNGGDEWVPLTDNFAALGISDIIVKKDGNNDKIYLATGIRSLGNHYGHGVVKSVDGGLNWQFTTLIPGISNGSLVITRLLAHPALTDCFYAIGFLKDGREAYIFKTYNGFQTFDTCLLKENAELFDIEFRPGDTNTVYVSGSHLYRSSDAGLTWDTLTDYLNLTDKQMISRAEIAIHPDDPDMLLTVLEAIDTSDINKPVYCQRLYRSADQGDTFQEIPPNDSIEIYADNFIAYDAGYFKMELEISPADINTIYTGGLYIRKYNLYNDTAHLLEIVPPSSTRYHVDIRYLKIYEGLYDIIYQGNDGGVTRSLDGGMSWEDLSKNGLGITQFYAFGIADFSDKALAGTQDGNFNFYNYNTDRWLQIFGDAGECIIDYDNADIMYAAHFCAPFGISKSIDGGEHFYVKINYNELDNVYTNINPFIMHPIDPQILYLGLHDIYKNINGAEGDSSSWQKISDFTGNLYALPGQNLRAIGISKSNPDYIYAGFYNPTWDVPNNDNDTVRLVRTKNGGNSWETINKNADYNWAGITDIVVNPNDSSEFWVTLGNFWEYEGDLHKVYRYEQCGDVMSNYSDGLPNLPVNCIAYYEGSNLNELFIGTDAGVFYRNDTMDQWQPFNDRLPVCIVTDLEINYRKNKLVASTFGRGMWETQLRVCEDQPDTLFITQDTTWNSTVPICGDMVIQPGAWLTVKGTVLMNHYKKIFIKPGAILHLDGGKIYSGCEELWGGVEVWGNPLLTQTPTYQGTLIITNNGLIADARIGVRLGKETYQAIPASGYSGGILFANTAVFRNNLTSVWFDPYDRPNISQLIKSTFETTDLLYSLGEPNSFIRFNQVQSVRIKGCHFENKTDLEDISFENRGDGIYSLNSHFIVEEFTQDSISGHYVTKSEFEGLNYGIKALNGIPDKTVTIDSSVFTANRCGIYLSAVDYATVTSNFFYPDYQLQIDTICGLYLDACTGYKVEENIFWGYYISEGEGEITRFGIGTVINNSGEQFNELYNNKYTSLYVGTIAQNRNRNEDGSDGLQITCNDYFNTSFDIFVTKEDPGADKMGIAESQGSNTNSTDAPAGNSFTQSPENHEGNYKNVCENIVYWHHLTASGYYKIIPTHHTPEPTIVLDTNIFGYTFIKNQSCPSKLGSGGGGEIESEKMAMELFQFQSDSISDLLSLLIDGGNTQELNLSVQSSWTEDAPEIYNELIADSPYLSDTVLVSAIKQEDVLSTSLVTDILIANPQSAKSDTVLIEVENRINQLSEDQRYDFEQGMYYMGAKESLQSRLSHFNSLYNQASNNIIRYYINDSLPCSVDSLLNMMENESQIESQYSLAFIYYQKNDSLGVINTLESIPTNYSLSEEEHNNHSLYEDYFDVLLSIASENKTILEIDSSHRSILYTILAGSYGKLKAMVRNVLIVTDSLIYHEPYLLPEEDLKIVQIRSKPIKEKPLTNKFSIYPNPAVNYIIIDYCLDHEPDNCYLQLLDSSGKLFRNIPIKENEGYLVIQLAELESGVYLCRLHDNCNEGGGYKFIVK